MSVPDAEAMRKAVSDAIGRDGVYIAAGESVRRFDPLSVTVLYGGQLLFGFAKAGATWLWEVVKKKGAETGEKAVGDLLELGLNKLETAVSLKNPEKGEDEKGAKVDEKAALQVQAHQLDLASTALRELGRAAEPAYLESFLSAGQAAVTQQLMSDNFPKAKAERIAAAVALQVELQMKAA